jgi:uncharacterized protein YdaT
MRWNEDYFPRSMAHLPSGLRDRAIAIANALLGEGYEEARAIRIAIAQARRWTAAQPPLRANTHRKATAI